MGEKESRVWVEGADGMLYRGRGIYYDVRAEGGQSPGSLYKPRSCVKGYILLRGQKGDYDVTARQGVQSPGSLYKACGTTIQQHHRHHHSGP